MKLLLPRSRRSRAEISLRSVPDRIVIASGNAGKLREIERILAEFNIAVVLQSELGVSDAIETGTSFVENALIKARHAVEATGLAALADDSGLAVDALDGRPGVYSARYSGHDANDRSNIEKLLQELDAVADDQRGASFYCVACLVTPDNAEPVVATGEWRGSILRELRGAGGFGYDPVFFDPELGRSAAELGAAQKNAGSHRGKALRALARQLKQRQ